MHQPFYKDLMTGEYRLPWTRMHALKDYYGMVKILEEFPSVHQTFNLVPSMMVQVEEYARGEANDPSLKLALKPAEMLTPGDKTFLLGNFFMANPSRMIFRYPRYGELYTACQAQREFSTQDYRDLQMLSQLAWFDEEFREKDPLIRALMEKGENYSLEDQVLMGRKQTEICAQVIPQYAKLAQTGQIEISTTPFYHPILPLICDTDIGAVSHPQLPLPPRFSYPEDARLQLTMARDYVRETFGVAPVGLWPSEGSVSDQALQIAAEVGFKWAATDNGVLGRTLDKIATPEITYRPYLWTHKGNAMRMIFRDHVLSDLIGFVYSGMEAQTAAKDFLRRINRNCRGILAAGRDALVPIILDGENAWEYYDHNGRPFFRALYSGIVADPRMEALTASEAFAKLEPAPLCRIFPGSWINANFDVWIGAEEDNKAWKFLLAARQAYDDAQDVPEERRKLALQELLIAEGSDWNWWYGPEHDSANRVEFDELYRDHLSNIYRALGLDPPIELSHPILQAAIGSAHTLPSGAVNAADWSRAGVYQVDLRSGAMHGKRELVKTVRYGTDGETAYLRVEFVSLPASLDHLEIRLHPEGEVRIEDGVAVVQSGEIEAVLGDFLLEIAIPGLKTGGGVSLSFWQDGLPLETIPHEGEFQFSESAAMSSG